MTVDPPSTPTSDDHEGGYARALSELDQILRELDGADVDVDLLAERVRRAARLIEICRARIDGARVQIDSVIADLDAASSRREHGHATDTDPA